MSVENIITENLDIWTSAIKTKSASGRGSSKKLELYGIKRLRKLILDLATSGKLTAQEQTDQPVGLLLEKLKDERLSLRKNQNLKKIKSLPPISENEIMAEIPNSWAWIRFGECVVIRSGNSFPKEKEVPEGNIPYCKVGDMNLPENKTSITTSSRYINPNSKDLLALIPANSIAFPKRGGAIATNKKKYVKQPLFVDLNVMAVTPFEPLLLEYVMIWLESIDLAELNTGTSVPQINNKDVEPLLFPCPPIDEQRRIVEKVNELKSLCDLLESQTEASIEAHQTLVKSLLETLTNAKDADELNESWQCISEHFDVLFTTEESIDQLKQTILQLAVMGKLVKQDPNDEPASKLLERIAAEKEQLIKDKKIKKRKKLPPISEDEKPFQLPSGWEWARISDALELKNGYAFKSEFFVEKGRYVLTTPGNFYEKGGFRDRGEKTKYYQGPVSSEFLLAADDLIIPMTEQAAGLLGSAAFIPNDGQVYLHNQRLAKLTLINSQLKAWFVYWFFNSSYLRGELANTATGMKVKHTSLDKIYKILIPIPPAKEQIRIVEKISSLMSLCESINEIHIKRENLLIRLAESVSKIR